MGGKGEGRERNGRGRGGEGKEGRGGEGGDGPPTATPGSALAPHRNPESATVEYSSYDIIMVLASTDCVVFETSSFFSLGLV